MPKTTEQCLIELKEAIRADNDQFTAVAVSVIHLLEIGCQLGGMNDFEAEILQQCRAKAKELTGL